MPEIEAQSTNHVIHDLAAQIDKKNQTFIQTMKNRLKNLESYSDAALNWLMLEHYQFSFRNTFFLEAAAKITSSFQEKGIEQELLRNLTEETDHAEIYRKAFLRYGVKVEDRVEFVPTSEFLHRLETIISISPSHALGALYATETAAIFEHEVFKDITEEVLTRSHLEKEGAELTAYHDMHLSGVEQSHKDELGVFINFSDETPSNNSKEDIRNRRDMQTGAYEAIYIMTTWWEALLENASRMSNYDAHFENSDFELNLQIKNKDFIQCSEHQADWLIQKFMNESKRDIECLKPISKSFVSGNKRPVMPDDWEGAVAKYQESELVIEGHQVMQSWEDTIMKEMAQTISETQGDILEIGFGMGISASYIQDQQVKSHTIVECNDQVVEAFSKWKAGYSNKEINVIHGKWQDSLDQLKHYDGILFDPYFVSESDSVEVESTTAIGSFLSVILPHLRKGGVVTYFTREIDSLSRAHQRLLLKYFSTVTLTRVDDLVPPENCNYWWANSMMVVKAVKN